MTESPERLVLDILQHEWEDSMSFGLTPSITFGWFDDDKDIPQITVAQSEEEPLDGGDTGFSGIGPDGPTQKIVGTVDVHFWCRPRDLDQANTPNPRQYNSRATTSAKNIISDGYQDRPVNPRTGNRPVNFLSYGGKTPVPEPDDTLKMVRHYVMSINFGSGPS